MNLPISLAPPSNLLIGRAASDAHELSCGHYDFRSHMPSGFLWLSTLLFTPVTLKRPQL
jgi:hypothetical protein